MEAAHSGLQAVGNRGWGGDVDGETAGNAFAVAASGFLTVGALFDPGRGRSFGWGVAKRVAMLSCGRSNLVWTRPRVAS